MKVLHLVTAAAMMAVNPASSFACSSFGSPDASHPMMGKSYDWSLAHGMITVNKRNVDKVSLAIDPRDNPAEWVSKYGSITFNQYGRELPNGGLNEAGLAVEILWFSTTQYPARDQRGVLNEAQWIQYHLDNYGSVKEMIQNINKVRLQPVFAQVHYLACDKSGDCASFEYINRKMVIHTGVDMPFKGITNSTYASSAQELGKYVGFGGTEKIPMKGYISTDRFVRLAHLGQGFNGLTTTDERVQHSFSMLSAVESVGYSRWNIVYDFAQGEIHFKNLDVAPTVKTFRMSDFDFSCSTPVKTFDMHTVANGKIASLFADYDPVENQAMVQKSGDHHGMPQMLIDVVSTLPETTECMDGLSN